MNFSVHSILIWCGAFFAAIVLALAEIKQFTAWSQVIYLWDLDADLVELIKDPHYPRFLIAYPGLLLREELSDFGFSLYISIFLHLIVCCGEILLRNILDLILYYFLG